MKKGRVKKIVSMTLAAVMLCMPCMLGCSRRYADEELETAENRELFPDFAYDSATGPYYQNENYSIAVAEKGYYFEVTGGAYYDKPRKIIYYYDINSGKSVPLCTKIGCKHNTDSCDAMFMEVETKTADWSGFTYYNHRLYILAYDKNNGARLVSYDEQGLNRKEELKLSDDVNYIPRSSGANAFCIYNGYIYYWLVKNDSVNRTAHSELCRKKLDNSDDVKVIFTKDENAEQNYETNNSFYFCTMYPTSTAIYLTSCTYDESTQKRSTDLYKVSKDNMDTEELVLRAAYSRKGEYAEGEEIMNLSGSCIDDAGNLYYYEKGEGIYQYNIEKKSKKIIYKTSATSVSFSCDNEYLYIKVENNEIADGKFVSSDIKMVIVDHAGAIKYERPMKTNRLSRNTLKVPRICDFIGADDRYVIMRVSNDADFSFNEEAETVSIRGGETTVEVLKETDRYKLAALPKSQIGTGNEEWIEMYNGMNVQ